MMMNAAVKDNRAPSSAGAGTVAPSTAAFYNHKQNQLLCHVLFFLASWVSSALSVLVSNRRRATDVIYPILTFFAFQAVGSIAIGILMDMKGRRYGMKVCFMLMMFGVLMALGTLIAYNPKPICQIIWVPPPFNTPGSPSTLEESASTLTRFFIAVPTSTRHDVLPFMMGFPPSSSHFHIMFLLSVAVLGLSVGGSYPAAAVTLAESVPGCQRITVISVLICMQGLSQFGVRGAMSIIFSMSESSSLQLVLVVLLAMGFLLCLIFGVYLPYGAVETGLYITSLSPSTPRQAPTALSSVDSVPNGDLAGTLGTPLLRASSGTRTISASNKVSPSSNGPVQPVPPSVSLIKYRKLLKRYFQVFFLDFLGTAVPWCVFDFLFYGDGIFHFLLVQRVKGFDTNSEENMFALVVTFVCCFGYLLAAVLVRRVTPKLVRRAVSVQCSGIAVDHHCQILGFVVVSFVYFGLALSLYSIAHSTSEDQQQRSISEYIGASLLYDCVFRFFIFIPNLTVFLIPLASFPTQLRGTFYGASVTAARIGALMGMVLSWKVVEPYLCRATMLAACSLLALVAAVTTRALTPHIQPDLAELNELDVQYHARTSHANWKNVLNRNVRGGSGGAFPSGEEDESVASRNRQRISGDI